MANYPESAFQMAIGRIPQTNYLTPTAASTSPVNFIEQLIGSPAIMSVKPNRATNAGQTTGNRFASESWVDSWTSDGSYDFWLTSQNAGRYFYAALGGYTVAAVSGSAGAYKHTFKPIDTSATAQLPSYSIVPQLAASSSVVNSLFPSNVCSAFSITSTGKDRVSANASWVGSGDEITPSGITWATHVTPVQGTQNNFYNTNTNILVAADDNGGGGFTTCELKSWNFGIANSFADGDYGCPRFKISGNVESGALRSHLLLTGTEFSAGFTLRLRPSDPAYAMLVNQTPTVLRFSLIGGAIGATVSNHKLDIAFALTYYESATRGFDEGFAVIEITPTALFSTGSNAILTVELTNNIASYAS